MKTLENPFDMIGQPISLNDVVVTHKENNLVLCKVLKFNAKMIKIVILGKKKGWYKSEFNRYPHDLVVLEKSQVSMFLLKNSV